MQKRNDKYVNTYIYMNIHEIIKVCAEQTKLMADSCFRLFGPHQHHVRLAVLRRLDLYIYPRQA